MFLINTVFQASRSRKYPDKPGRVYLRISQRESCRKGGCNRISKSIGLNIKASEKGRISDDDLRRIVQYVRILYCIIERHQSKGGSFDIEDIASDFRRAQEGDKSMDDIIKMSMEEFPIRADLVNLGKELKGYFKFVSSVNTESNPENILDYIEGNVRRFNNEGKHSAERSWSSVGNSLSRFVDGNKLSFKQINREFIVKYNDWLGSTGVSINTQSFYLRKLRTVLNHAADEGLFKGNRSLFKGLNTSIYSTDRKESAQSALSKEIIRKIANSDFSTNQDIEIVRDMFMFGFYCKGMELVEVMNLKKSNITNGALIYRRRMVGNERVVQLEEAATKIIRKYANSSESYLFPLVTRNVGRQHYSISDKVRYNLKLIGNSVGYPKLTFNMNISSYQYLMSQIHSSNLLLES